MPLADPAVPDDFFEVPAKKLPTHDRIEFSIAGIDLLDEQDNRTHDVRLVLHNNAQRQSFWLFGASNTGSGITFNPETLEDRVIQRG